MEISHFLNQIEGSATALIFSKAKEIERKGINVIHFEIGQPDFLPIKKILDATQDALKQGKTQYTVSRGIPELRDEISKYHSQISVEEINSNKETIVTAGGKLGIFASLWTVLNHGDNVIILNPSWVSYVDIVVSLGCEPRFVPVDLDFNLDFQDLRKNIDSKTKALIVNSPSNPTGAIISLKNLQMIYDICAENDILLISDEMYSEYIYGEKKHASLLEIKDWKDQGALVHGFSKTFSMTGFRMGYVLSNENIISQINKVNQLTASCPVNFAQYGGIIALQNIDEMRSKINSIMPKRVQLLDSLLGELPVQYQSPDGAIYAWLKIPNVTDSIAWAEKLLEKANVAVTPGRAFGPAGEGFIRISFATTESIIEEGINRIEKFLS